MACWPSLTSSVTRGTVSVWDFEKAKVLGFGCVSGQGAALLLLEVAVDLQRPHIPSKQTSEFSSTEDYYRYKALDSQISSAVEQ